MNQKNKQNYLFGTRSVRPTNVPVNSGTAGEDAASEARGLPNEQGGVKGCVEKAASPTPPKKKKKQTKKKTHPTLTGKQ